MFESYTGSSGVILDAIRTLFSWLDRAAFGLLEFFYQLFFNVASADLFSNDTIMKFYGRVQLIIGVYMMFLLAMTILRGIMNPDDFFGGKDGGSGSKLITRIMTSLIMLTVLVPINIGSPRNEYETQIHNNGLLFGTLYSLQHRILANNTLGRLILGNDSTSSSYFSSEGEDTLKQSSRIFTSTVLKGFYRINLKDEDDRTKHEDGKDDAIFNENRVCEDIDDDVLAAYTRIDANPGDIIGMVNATCEVDDGSMNLLQKAISLFSPKLAGKQRYVFTMMPLVSTVTAIIFAVILLSFSIDVAIRAVKLAVLRLLAPIPIISYMDPKGGKDGAFNSWVKTLSSTYLDLFIRLSVVYFVIFLIQDMIVNGVVINNGTGLVGILSLIIIWIGLFMFAKQAPKFIKEVLGIKNDSMGNIFGRAFGIAAAGAGAVGSGFASARASRLADETREAFGQIPEGSSTKLVNRGKHLLSGIAGGIAGGFTGMNAAVGAKDNALKASMDAMQKRNADAIARGNSGSTLLGRMKSTGSNVLFGEGSSAADERRIASMEGRQKALDAIKARVSGEMVKQDWTRGSAGKLNSSGVWEGLVDTSGNAIDGTVNYKDFMARKNAAASANQTEFDITMYDANGHSHTRTVSMVNANFNEGLILKNNEDSYISIMTDPNSGRTDTELNSLITDAMAKGGSGWNGTSYSTDYHGEIHSRDDYIKGSEGLGQDIRTSRRSNTINKANDQYSGKK